MNWYHPIHLILITLSTGLIYCEPDIGRSISFTPEGIGSYIDVIIKRPGSDDNHQALPNLLGFLDSNPVIKESINEILDKPQYQVTKFQAMKYWHSFYSQGKKEVDLYKLGIDIIDYTYHHQDFFNLIQELITNIIKDNPTLLDDFFKAFEKLLEKDPPILGLLKEAVSDFCYEDEKIYQEAITLLLNLTKTNPTTISDILSRLVKIDKAAHTPGSSAGAYAGRRCQTKPKPNLISSPEIKLNSTDTKPELNSNQPISIDINNQSNDKLTYNRPTQIITDKVTTENESTHYTKLETEPPISDLSEGIIEPNPPSNTLEATTNPFHSPKIENSKPESSSTSPDTIITAPPPEPLDNNPDPVSGSSPFPVELGPVINSELEPNPINPIVDSKPNPNTNNAIELPPQPSQDSIVLSEPDNEPAPISSPLPSPVDTHQPESVSSIVSTSIEPLNQPTSDPGLSTGTDPIIDSVPATEPVPDINNGLGLNSPAAYDPVMPSEINGETNPIPQTEPIPDINPESIVNSPDPSIGSGMNSGVESTVEPPPQPTNDPGLSSDINGETNPIPSAEPLPEINPDIGMNPPDPSISSELSQGVDSVVEPPPQPTNDLGLPSEVSDPTPSDPTPIDIPSSSPAPASDPPLAPFSSLLSSNPEFGTEDSGSAPEPEVVGVGSDGKVEVAPSDLPSITTDLQIEEPTPITTPTPTTPAPTTSFDLPPPPTGQIDLDSLSTPSSLPDQIDLNSLSTPTNLPDPSLPSPSNSDSNDHQPDDDEHGSEIGEDEDKGDDDKEEEKESGDQLPSDENDEGLKSVVNQNNGFFIF